MKISKRFCCNNLLFVVFALLAVCSLSSCFSPPAVRVAASQTLLNKSHDDIRDIAVVVEADSDETRNIEDGLYVVLLNYGYNVVARSDVKTLMKEINFQGSGLTDGDATKIGKMLNVKIVMVARSETSSRRNTNHPSVVETSRLSLRVIDVEDGEVLILANSESQSFSGFTLAKGAALKGVPPLRKQPEGEQFFEKDTGSVENINDITSLDKIAILFTDKNTHKTTAVEDMFMGFLMSYKYKIASRSDVEKALQEINFQGSGLTEQGASRLGKMLNVKAVMVIEIADFKSGRDRSGQHTAVELSARLIDLEKNKLLWVCHKYGFSRGGRDATDAFENAVSSIMSSFPKK